MHCLHHLHIEWLEIKRCIIIVAERNTQSDFVAEAQNSEYCNEDCRDKAKDRGVFVSDGSNATRQPS